MTAMAAAGENAEPSPAPELGKSVALNSSAVAASQVAIVAIGLILTPFIVNRLGLVLFGLWGFVTTTVAFLSVLDPGLGSIVIRYGAQAAHREDTRFAARLTTLGLIVWLGVGLLLSPLLLVVVPPLIASLHVVSGEVLPTHLVHTAEWFFVWGYAYLFITAASSILGCRLIAAGEQWIVTIIGLVSRFIYAGAMVAFLVSGAGLWGVALASSIQTLSVIVATVTVTARRHRTVLANPAILGRPAIAEMLRFGGLVQLSGILDALNYDTDPIVLGRFVSVTAAGLYQLGSRAASQIAYLVAIPQQSLLQTFSRRAGGDATPDDVRAPAIQASRYMGLAALLAAGAVAAGAPWLLRIWLGRTYDGLESVLLLLLALQVVNAARSNCAIVIVALGRAGLGARAKAVAVVVNAAATIALVIPFGITGVLVGTIAASIVQNAFLIRRYAAMLETTVWTVLWQWYAPLLGTTVIAVGAARIVGLALPSGPHLSLLGATFGAVISVGAFCLVFAAGLRRTGYLHHDDLTYLSEILPGPLGRIPRWSIIHMVARGDR
jgi:O-antigen/teichoic acid export membrane protein